MKKLRVLLLVDSDLMPPDTVEGDYTEQPWKTEYDVLVTLRGLGHEVRTLGMTRDLSPLREAYAEWKPHIAFNMLEDVYGVVHYDLNVVAFMELLGLPYTGCNPTGLLISRDKALAKKLLVYHRIRTPRFMVCRRGAKVRRPTALPFPLIVKSLIEDASAGIGQRSVVDKDDALAERVGFIHEQIGTDAIAEEFIGGREIYMGLLGNRRIEAFPPWELIVENPPRNGQFLATRRLKWDKRYQKKVGMKTRRAENLPEGLEERLKKISRRIFHILNLNGYARLDFRLGPNDEPYLLEANANPAISYGEDYAESAEHAGVGYEKLIQRILNLGLRWHEDHRIV